jgi:release factor glutamine methyltransferase
MTLRELATSAETQLKTSPHPDRARQDADTLLLHALGQGGMSQDRAWLLAHWDDESDAEIKCLYEASVARRQIGEPLQYITGQSEFYGLPFSVGPGVLIPRPETEHLVEEVLRLAAQFAEPAIRIADIGTGSGIIAVALANALPQARISAVDCSPQALVIARENAAQNRVSDRIEFIEGDLLGMLAGERFGIIASNPPYIPERDHDLLSVEVRDHEPHSALFAGDDGLDLYRRLIPEAFPLLKPNGWLVLEIGYGQQPAIESLLESAGYREIHFIPDYQSIPRVASGRKP